MKGGELNEICIETDIKGTHPFTLPGGVYFFSSISFKNDYFGISTNSTEKNPFIISEKSTCYSNQCFILQYYESEDYYTLMSLHSHKYLGVELQTDTKKYKNAPIIQKFRSNNFLMEWKIKVIKDTLFAFELLKTGLNLEANNDRKLILNTENINDKQTFFFRKHQLIKEGLYSISPRINKKKILTFSNEKITLSGCKSKMLGQKIFVKFDSNDGYYSFLNPENNLCFSSTRNAQSMTNIFPKNFYNNNYQKFVIGLNKKDGFFFELKSSPLRISVTGENEIKLLDCSKIEQFLLFNIYSEKANDQQKIEQCNNFATNVQKFTDLTKVIINEKSIPREKFENCIMLKKLEIPLSTTSIDKNAFENCKYIKYVKCDPKWLDLFPNPLNIENIVIPQGVKSIPKNCFQKYYNLKYISIPQSLEIENCDPDAFKDLYDIRIYEGNPSFLKYIHKLTLVSAFVPSYIEVIDEDTFAGCKYLKNVSFGENPKLTMIKSRAFANCESLETFKIPNSVTNVSPYAFHGCRNDFKIEFTNDEQKLSMIDNLIIDPKETKITKDYELCCNIESIEIPINLIEVEPGIFKKFTQVKFVKCNPILINEFITENIEIFFIPDGITDILKSDFDQLTHLKFLEIPKSVKNIENNCFANNAELTSVKCGTNHLQFLNQSQIKTLVLNDGVSKIYRSHFEGFINLESCTFPESVDHISPDAFHNCKKLMRINNSSQSPLINKSVSIDPDNDAISKEEFENWTNLEFLEIPNSITTIEKGTFDNCINIKSLICDPKWYPYFKVNFIRTLVVPDYVMELNRGTFDEFYMLSSIEIPEHVIIDDPTLFDNCESLVEIKCDSSLFHRLSFKTIERCVNFKAPEYEKPIYDFQPDQTKVLDKTKPNYNKNQSNDEFFSFSPYNQSYRRQKETSIDDLVRFDSYNKKYRSHINKVLWYIQSGEDITKSKPKNSDLGEIAKVCGSICYEIRNNFNIIPRPVQLLAILRLADEVLNNQNSHGAIGEIKTGEGKSLIVTVLSIILVKYNRTVDIVTSNLELAKRDQKEQSKYFNIFNIKTSVLYSKNMDFEFYTSSIDFSFTEDQSPFKDYNVKDLQCPVVYSTNSNFEFMYLDSIFSEYSRSRKYDVVIVDEVDNMFIDESDSPAIMTRPINYAFSKDILEIVYLLHSWKTSDIIQILKYYLPNASKYRTEDIEVLKNAAQIAHKRIKDVDYIIENGQIVIIDQNTGFKRQLTRWHGYVHEMVEIKEGIEPRQPSVPFCQITQHGYFNLYKKIAGVTGTIGSKDDEEMLREGFNVNLFKVPRHIASQLKIVYQNRPDKLSKVYDLVNSEIRNEIRKGRPVLVIWDSIQHANEFLKVKNYSDVNKITGVDPILDRHNITQAGIPETLTIATSAAGRGVDIKLTEESLENGGLHVIIPMNLPSQRSLAQAVGRSGRQGQPGTATILISDDDSFVKTSRFRKGNDNLVKLELYFARYLRRNFPWILSAPQQYGFKNDPIFPYASDYKDVLAILARCISLLIPKNFINIHFKKNMEIFKDFALTMVHTAWGTFFSNIREDDLNFDSWEYCERQYNKFIEELSKWLCPGKSTNPYSALWFLNTQLIKFVDREYLIVNGLKIASSALTVIFPEAAPHIRLITGTVLSGGLEVYHQLQNGDKINWAQVLVCAGGGAIRSIIDEKYWPVNPLINYGIDIAEGLLYGLSDVFNDKQKIEFPELPKNISIKGISKRTGEWLAYQIKFKIAKNKKKKLSQYMPKIKAEVPQLEVSFIKMTMTLASEAYNDDGEFSIGRKLLSCHLNEMYKPKFYCLDISNTLYIAIRGSYSKCDWMTDFDCREIRQEIDGNIFYFHKGFYTAANYVLDNVKDLIHEYDSIYFVGHSYAGAVSSVLCMLTKTSNEFKDKNIFTMAYAPAPSMSAVPSYVSDCIFAFINKHDMVPHMSLTNLYTASIVYKKDILLYVRLILNILKASKSLWSKSLAKIVEDSCDMINEISKEYPHNLHVQKIKGRIFGIGLLTSSNINDCKLDELDLPNTLVLAPTSAFDHLMSSYLKSFEIFEI